MQDDSERKPKFRVIVRAWGKEPVSLFSYHKDGKDSYGCHGVGHITNGLPFEQVFSYDVHRFCTAHRAFEDGDTNKISSRYDAMTKIVLAIGTKLTFLTESFQPLIEKS